MSRCGFIFLACICYASCICGFVSSISFQTLPLFRSLFSLLFAMQFLMNLIFSFQASNVQTSPSCCPSTPIPHFFVAYSGKSFPVFNFLKSLFCLTPLLHFLLQQWIFFAVLLSYNWYTKKWHKLDVYNLICLDMCIYLWDHHHKLLFGSLIKH